jgi:hypothetical protein
MSRHFHLNRKKPKKQNKERKKKKRKKTAHGSVACKKNGHVLMEKKEGKKDEESIYNTWLPLLSHA